MICFTGTDSPLDELWILEWSEAQKCYHIDFLAQSLKNNFVRCRLEHNSIDYVPIAISDSFDDLSGLAQTIDANYPRINKRGGPING